MRFLIALVFPLLFSANALAALSSNDWQSQLQGQLQALQSSGIHAVGDVAVQQSGNVLRATMPPLTITSPDSSYWTIPSIIIQGSTSSDAITLMLPATITRYNSGKQEIARMVIGAQAINGRWNEGNHSFESLNGVIRNVSFNDTIANAKTTVANISITANKGSPVQFFANDIRSIAVQNGKTLNSSIAKSTTIYQLPNADNMSLAHLVGYFNPAILLSENKEVVFSVSAEQISMQGVDNRTTTLQKLNTKFDLQPKGKTVAANISAQAYIVSQNPPSPYSVVLPRQADITAVVNNMPIEMISFAPGMSTKMAKQAMDNAGTVINISKLNVTTFDNAKLTGNGSLKADSQTPSGFNGRITLDIENLKDIIAANQLQLLQPDNGTNRSAKTQSLMAMMMLQGMGKQQGNQTEFILDLTADGQTLVNGQDFSGLMGSKPKAKTIDTLPSIPLEKVKSSNL